MINKSRIGAALFSLSTLSNGQSTKLIVPGNVKLPKDTLISAKLLNSLNGFLNEKEKANDKNSFVLTEDLPETSVLLDEIKTIEESERTKDPNFYTCYLTNVLFLDSTSYALQFSYMGLIETTPVLRASFKVLAVKRGERYFICSPLKYNTRHWELLNIGNVDLYYQETFVRKKAKGYFDLIDLYDKKLGIAPIRTKFYACANFNEALQLIGVEYKADFNGRRGGILTATEQGVFVNMDAYFVMEKGDVDPHDLWHSRLHKIVSAAIINKPVDEGTAYLYGGSWGLSWKEILKRFKNYAATHPNADWLALYNESKNFDELAKFPLNVDYVINALIVNKIEKEKGFASVIELAKCGKYEKGNANYFSSLETITGITRTNFNDTIWKLIKGN